MDKQSGTRYGDGSGNQYSSAVTTGQSDWRSNINTARGYGQRAPIPTCGIPPASFTSTKIFTTGPSQGDLRSKQANNAEAIQGTRGSDSAESMQQALQEPELSEPGSLSLSESDLSEDDDKHLGTRKSSKFQNIKRSKEKKKVGRPIAYRGDPNSPELTEPERRRIKRRIANRESARRVRHKRQEMLEDLQLKIDRLHSQNMDLRSTAVEATHQKEDLSRQLRDITEKYRALVSMNENMQCELQSLRSSMQVRMNVLEDALDKQDLGLPPLVVEDHSVFGTVQAQSSQAPGYVSQPIFPFPSHTDFKGSFSFQLDYDYMSALDDQRSLELLNTTNQELALFKTEPSLFKTEPSLFKPDTRL